MHGTVTGEHAREWWGHGAFFVSAAAAQAVFGILLLGQPWRHDATGRYDPGRGRDVARALYRAGLVVNVLMVLMYALTRTVGIPLFGPEAGEREALNAAGVVAVALELGLSACLAALLAAERQP